jgi:hypothetical protein
MVRRLSAPEGLLERVHQKGYLTPVASVAAFRKDGMAPPGYKDCVPYYPTLVKQ